MSLGNNIRYLRRQRGMSQDEFAARLGYKSYTTIQKWESGVSEPPIKIADAIAKMFNVDIADLVNADLTDVAPSAPQISDEALQIARAYDRADEKSRELVDLALREYLPAKKQDTASVG